MARRSALFSLLTLRIKYIVVMNLLFYGGVFISSVLMSFFFPLQLYGWQLGEFSGNFALDVLSVFLFNLTVSSFAVITLPGFVLFPLSATFLIYRAFIWGSLIYQLPNSVFLTSLIPLILEGEGYVFAAVAGALVGISWVKTGWIYPKVSISRSTALRKALRESALFYVLVVVLLLVAAVIETAILFDLLTSLRGTLFL